jgi:hypothetical protein
VLPVLIHPHSVRGEAASPLPPSPCRCISSFCLLADGAAPGVAALVLPIDAVVSRFPQTLTTCSETSASGLQCSVKDSVSLISFSHGLPGPLPNRSLAGVPDGTHVVVAVSVHHQKLMVVEHCRSEGAPLPVFVGFGEQTAFGSAKTG